MEKETGKRWGKKGLSPVIATVLLVSMVIILGLIIWLWARSFVGEKLEKFGEPVEGFCQEIEFEAEYDTTNNEIDVVNRGNVALYGIEIRKKGRGSIENLGVFDKTIVSGETSSVEFSGGSGEELVVVPIILGETSKHKRAYTCNLDYGIEVNI